MKIYFAPNSRAVRVVWLFEELGLPYDLEVFKLGEKRMRDAEYLKTHPMGRVPALEDGDVTLFESGAIIQYVLAKYGDGRLVPDVDSPEFPAYLQWFHYAEGMLMPPVNTLVVETMFLPEEKRNPTNISRATRLLNKMLDPINERLADRDYLAGDFSAADIITGHACIVSSRRAGDISDKPNLQAYVERLQQRPAFQRVTAIGA
ncbi:MAG: glutathione S-transferase family protein [Rhodospirillaceae bacterium]|jgi:glutathione S-transferase|nr:glutathione S-transferase family protein [Rhodospirillaceae bacterium]